MNNKCSLYLCRDSKAVELVLSNAESYSEWIPGEGGDIGLIRDKATNAVIGIRLPCTATEVVLDGNGISTTTIEVNP